MENNLLSGAINLTFFGMGFVFIFLTILVFITKFMSYILNRNNDKHKINSTLKGNTLMSDTDIDDETKFVIEQAIKIHTGA